MCHIIKACSIIHYIKEHHMETLKVKVLINKKNKTCLFNVFLYSEKDVNGDTLWVWCYPSVGSEMRQVLLSKCCLTQDSRDFHTFVFGQFCRTWYYISTVEVQEPTALNKVPPSLPSLIENIADTVVDHCVFI